MLRPDARSMPLPVRCLSLACALLCAATVPTVQAAPNQIEAIASADVAPSDGLTLEWISSLGSGYSGLAADDERVYTLFTSGESDVLAGFDLESGDELWRYEIGEFYAGHDGSHDGPSSTPAVGDGSVCGLAPRGELFCLNAATGEEAWRVDLVEKYSGDKPWYGMSTTPLIDDGRLIVEFSTGGSSSISAFSLETGERLWAVGKDTIAYQSPAWITLGGERQVLAVGNEYLYGISPTDGAVRWEYEHGGDGSAIGAESIQPIFAGANRVLLMNRRDESKLVEIQRAGDDYEVVELWKSGSIRNSYTPPVYHEGHFYGYSNRFLTCVDASTGEAVWRSREPGDGFLSIVGGQLAILTKKGSLHIVDLDSEAYRERARYELFEDASWTSPLGHDGDLIVRSMGRIARMRVEGESSPMVGFQVPEGMDRSFMMMLLNGLMKSEEPTAALESFWKTVDIAPVREGDSLLHFIYRGDVDDVALASDITGSRHEEPMNKVPGTDLFWFSKFVDVDALFTYRFVLEFEEEVPDPRNPNRVTIGDSERSWYAMPEYEEPGYLTREVENGGRLDRIEIEYPGSDEPTAVDVYLPAGYDGGEERYPTLYVHDAEAAMEQGNFVSSLDALIDGGTIEPVVAVFVHAPPRDPDADPETQWNAYSDAVAATLVPAIDQRFRTIAKRDARGTLGAGPWAGRALHLSLRHEEVFSRLAMHSAFMLTSAMNLVESALEEAEGLPLVVYHDWGKYDPRTEVEAWSMPEANRALAERLKEAGMEAAGGEVAQGGGWFHWKTRVGGALGTLFPVDGS